MKKQTEIRYPTQDWIDSWIDKYLDEHPDEKVEDFKELQAQAEDDWWGIEIDHDRPTPFDLTPEQKKAQKEIVKGMASRGKARAPVKRERKPNEEKRDIMNLLLRVLQEENGNATLTNPEKLIDFSIGENNYTVMLTCHRKPKAKDNWG